MDGRNSRYNRAVHPAVATAHDAYLLACVAGTVALLLLLVGRMRLHAALGLSVAALALGQSFGPVWLWRLYRAG